MPYSVITTRKGETSPPQILETRNTGRGTPDYQVNTDQPWLSVLPNQGYSAGETDSVEISVHPANLEPGAFEVEITITERQPVGDLPTPLTESTPAWPVTVPVTLIVIPNSREPLAAGTFSTYRRWGLALADEGPAVQASLCYPEGVAV